VADPSQNIDDLRDTINKELEEAMKDILNVEILDGDGAPSQVGITSQMQSPPSKPSHINHLS